MPDLAVRTRGNASPQGKPRVYFSCCPEDFEAYFGPMCADIFAAQDCAIYYNAEPESWSDLAVAYFSLGSLQPVRYSLLREAFQICSRLARTCPGVPDYAGFRDCIGSLLTGGN